MSDRYISTPVGFARLNKEPLDKYTVFNSITEAREYIASGPYYNGQEIAVINRDGSTATFIISNGTLKPVTLHGQNVNIIRHRYNGKSEILVYSHNLASGEYFSSDIQANTSQSCMSYSILDLLELYESRSQDAYDSNTKLSYRLEIYNHDKDEYTNVEFMDNNPVHDTNCTTILKATNDQAKYYYRYNNTRICPRVNLDDVNYSVNLYIIVS